MIAVLHAYSDANLGDRLLVELTLERLGRVGIERDELLVVALDADSFTDLAPVIACGTAGRSLRPELVQASVGSLGASLGAVTAGRAGWGRLAHTLADANGFVAVGGGYLRAGSIVEQIGVALNHVPQLLTASRSAAPSCYLPQSIGPLRGPVGRVLRSALERIDRVWVRDDTSLRELGLPNTEYMPDLAVLSIAEQGVAPVDPSDEVLVVARALDRGRPTYLPRLRALVAGLDNSVIWGTQAEGADEKSDAAFYSSIDVAPAGSTAELLASRRPSVVVSVRLHGSLMSIAAGCPTIHLSYQRKGWAAMRDLGLAEWVHDAGSFDPEVVAGQVEAIREDPSRYWETVAAALRPLGTRSLALDDAMADLFGPGSDRRTPRS